MSVSRLYSRMVLPNLAVRSLRTQIYCPGYVLTQKHSNQFKRVKCEHLISSRLDYAKHIWYCECCTSKFGYCYMCAKKFAFSTLEKNDGVCGRCSLKK